MPRSGGVSYRRILVAVIGGMAAQTTDWLTAIGTLASASGAVLIAGWAVWRERKRRPRLSLHFDPGRASDFDLCVELDEVQSHWIRARVQNAPGKASAHSAEVSLQNMVRHEAVGPVRVHLDGIAFKWANVNDTTATIPPGGERFVDLLSVFQPRDGHEGHERRLEVMVRPRPAGDRNMLEPGHYTFTLMVVALDTDAASYEMDVHFDGRWWTDPERVHEGLRVALLPRRRPRCFLWRRRTG